MVTRTRSGRVVPDHFRLKGPSAGRAELLAALAKFTRGAFKVKGATLVVARPMPMGERVMLVRKWGPKLRAEIARRAGTKTKKAKPAAGKAPKAGAAGPALGQLTEALRKGYAAARKAAKAKPQGGENMDRAVLVAKRTERNLAIVRTALVAAGERAELAQPFSDRAQGGGIGLASPTGSQRSVRAAQAEAIVAALRAANFEAYTFTRDD